MMSDTKEHVEIDILQSPKHIDACTFSPDGNHLATYSAAEGIITIWDVATLEKKEKRYLWLNDSTPLKPRAYRVEKKSFASDASKQISDVDFALSNEARFVALSTIKLPQEFEDPKPFELETGAEKFYTFVFDTFNSRPRREPAKLKGAIKFSSDNTKFIVCDMQPQKKNLLYIFSTQNWTLWKKDFSNIYDKFTNSLQCIYDPWNQIKFLKNSLLGDYFICVENWKQASFWSISERELITSIRYPAEDSFLNADKEPAVFALSHNKKKLAAWTSKGTLVIFSCEGGAILSSATSRDPKEETSILWSRRDQRIMIINATDGMQIRDAHTCMDIADENVRIAPNSVFQPTGSGLYVNYGKQVPLISKFTIERESEEQSVISENESADIVPTELESKNSKLKFNYSKLAPPPMARFGNRLRSKSRQDPNPIGLIRLYIDRATIDQALGLFLATGGVLDPYVTIADLATEPSADLATKPSYGKTKIVYNSKKPLWKQVFYISLYDQQKKLKLKVNDHNTFAKDIPLGTCILDVSKVVARARETNEAKCEKRYADLRYKGNVTGRLRFDVEFIPLDDDYLRKALDSPSFGLDCLYSILSLQSQTGSFQVDDRSAKLFNFSTVEELIQPFQENFKSLDKSIIVSAFVLSFFQVVLSKHETEWLTSYIKGENWIAESIKNIKTEERLYEEARNYIIEQFNFLESESQTDKTEGCTTLASSQYQDIRRILSYQTKGVYVLDARLAKLFGYESAEVARKNLRDWFSSKSIDVDEKIYCTAVLQCYFRYVLVDHRETWEDAYKKSSNWLSEQIGDEEVEKKLLEQARGFVHDRYKVDVTKDLSFKSTKKSKTEEEDVDEEFDYIEEDDEFEEFDDDNELCEDEYDDSDTTVVGILRVKIDQASDILSGGMGVRAFKVNSQGAAKKGTPAYTADSAYGVHCVPVRNAKGQLVFEIFDKTLTDFNAEFLLTLSDLITRNSDGLYNKKQALEKSEQINIPGGSKCKIRLNAQFYSTRSESGRFDFSKDTVDINDLYRLIGMTFNASLSDVSNNLALSFKVESASDFFHALATRIGTDKQLMSVSMRVWSTALIITYIKKFYQKFQSEWTLSINSSEQWISSQVYSIDVEERLYDLAKSVVTSYAPVERYVTDDGSLVYDEPSTIPETKSEILPSAPIADDPLNKPKSVSTDFISISQSVYSVVSPKTKSKRVHEFEKNGRNKVISYTRYEMRVIDSVRQFVTEPWVTTRVRTAVMLDDRNDRVLFIGKHTIQLWSNFAEESKTLQYILIIKQIREKDFIEKYFIEWAELTKLSGEVFIIEYKLKGRAAADKIHLPRKDASASLSTVSDASYALGILSSFEHRSWASEGYLHYGTLLDGCKLIIDRALSPSNGDVFRSTESADESEHKEIGATSNNDSKVAWGKILWVLIRFDCERTNTLIKELLKKAKFIREVDDFENWSVLSHAISLGRGDIVRSLLFYYCERATSVNEKLVEPNFENNLRIVVPKFGRLCEKHPDIALELVKKISYFKSKEPVVRSNNKLEGFAYSEREKSYINEHRNGDGYYYPYHKCLVPLPYFTRYQEPPESLFGFLNVCEWLDYLSPFASAVLYGKYHMFGEPAMEAIINFKWRKFARKRYVIFIGLYSLYLASFMAAVTLDSGRVHQGNVIKHLISLFSVIVLVLGFIFIAIEIMQLIAYRKHYFGMYNFIDLGSTILPMIYAVGVFFGSSWRLKYVGISMFFVYVDFILRLRVFKEFGIPIFIMIEIFKSVRGPILIIAMMVVAYTHIYWLLFSYVDVTDLVGNSTVTNDFSTPERTLVSAFFFVTGNFGSLSDAFGNPTVAFLAIVFSFITAVVLLNILIALMSDVVGNAKVVGKHVWLKQKAEFICELEMCMLTRKQRQGHDYFPYLIYYYAKDDSMQKYMKKEKGKKRKLTRKTT